MEADLATMMKLIFSLLSGGILASFAYIYTVFFVKPRRLKSRLQNQGIKGPSPSLLLGNIPEIRRIQTESAAAKTSQKKENPLPIDHDWPSTVFSHLNQWINEYGTASFPPLELKGPLCFLVKSVFFVLLDLFCVTLD